MCSSAAKEKLTHAKSIFNIFFEYSFAGMMAQTLRTAYEKHGSRDACGHNHCIMPCATAHSFSRKACGF